MTKSTTFLLAMAFLASLFTTTSPVQAAPIPSSSPLHTKRGSALGSSAPLITALEPFTNLAGQGLQTESAQLTGAAQDAGAAIKQQTDRATDMGDQALSGTGRAVVDAPANTNEVLQAAPV
ncbi:hypothetical protein BG015_005496 [Linnemannia schmuckeri]|uniref:Uncharacterized protein n=1 Tax=Linnemannia schmuckeri TaxID=64567 RepID=A0A9P5S4A5_9FUNG|nr:hypothetical protein BG015_005496 [Linnemannia schmuckeri]